MLGLYRPCVCWSRLRGLKGTLGTFTQLHGERNFTRLKTKWPALIAVPATSKEEKQVRKLGYVLPIPPHIERKGHRPLRRWVAEHRECDLDMRDCLRNRRHQRFR